MKGREAGGIEDGRTFFPDVIERSKWTHPVFHTPVLNKS